VGICTLPECPHPDRMLMVAGLCSSQWPIMLSSCKFLALPPHKTSTKPHINRSLQAMIVQFVVFIGTVIICFSGFLFALWVLGITPFIPQLHATADIPCSDPQLETERLIITTNRGHSSPSRGSAYKYGLETPTLPCLKPIAFILSSVLSW
jgi:hypothetical protein